MSISAWPSIEPSRPFSASARASSTSRRLRKTRKRRARKTIISGPPTAHLALRDDRLDRPGEREAEDQRPQHFPRHAEREAERPPELVPDRDREDHHRGRSVRPRAIAVMPATVSYGGRRGGPAAHM